ncbi:MAG: flippase-like domain-containing protein [Acidobacteriia bacterium]|nr:flippase-like domain-containing protein [Terriglobia bacterium]
MRGPERHWLRGLLVGVAVLLLLAILWLRLRGAPFQWERFFTTLHAIAWTWLALAILLMLLTYVGRALRWEVMLRPLGTKVGIVRLTSDTAIGFMAAVLLGRVGELVRPYLISVSAGVPFSSQLAAWFLERLLDLLAVLLIFGFALTRIPSHHLPLGAGLRWALGAGGYVVTLLGALCLVILVVFRNFSEVAERRILSAVSFLPDNYYKRSKSILKAFSEGVRSTRNPAFLSLLLAYTVLEWLVITASYYTLFRAFSATVSLKITDVVVILGFLSFGSVVQIPGIGGGLQVTAIVVLTELYGLSLEAASGIAMFLWVLTLLVIVPAGLLCAVHQGWNFSKIRQLAFERLPQQEPL